MLIFKHHSFFFNMERKHANIFLFLKNFCKHYTPRSDKESALKVLKFFKNDFALSGNIFGMIVIYTFWLMPSSPLQELFLNITNFNKNFEPLFLFNSRGRLNKEFSETCKCLFQYYVNHIFKQKS